MKAIEGEQDKLALPTCSKTERLLTRLLLAT